MAKNQNDDDDSGSTKRQYTTDEGPPPSKTRDTFSHHSSPHDEGDQRSVHGSLSRDVEKFAGNKVEMPEPLTKHSEPVGRPKNRNMD